MKHPRTIEDVVRCRLCVSCGACVSEAPEGAIEWLLDAKAGMYRPRVLDPKAAAGAFDVCPGGGLNIQALSRKLFGEDIPFSPWLGSYRQAWAARSTNADLLNRASSGGVMTALALFLLESRRIEGVTVTGMEYLPQGPRPVAKLARTVQELQDAQGSKYCPTSTNLLVRQCLKEGGRYLFLGTPCQVAALRLATQKDPRAAKAFPFTMANFCGGFRDFRQTDWLIRKHGIEPGDVRSFRYRGQGQPGSMQIETRDGSVKTEAYPQYLRGCPVKKLKRCVFCVDGTGLLADFACGDAWLDRYTQSGAAWSIILARSETAQKIIQEMVDQRLLTAEPVSEKDIKASQTVNLSSKIDRQYKRMQACRLVGMSLPRWDVSLPKNGTTYYNEVRTLVSKMASGNRVLAGLKRKIRSRRAGRAGK